LLEAFSEPCEHCKGRGVIIHMEPVADRKAIAPALPVVKEPSSEETFVDTEGYDLTRYEGAEEDELEAEPGESPVRRRTRRGGRRRTRP
jgi:ribonuclease E